MFRNEYEERNRAIATAILKQHPYRPLARYYNIAPSRIREITITVCRKANPELYNACPEDRPIVAYLRKHADEFIRAFSGPWPCPGSTISVSRKEQLPEGSSICLVHDIKECIWYWAKNNGTDKTTSQGFDIEEEAVEARDNNEIEWFPTYPK